MGYWKWLLKKLLKYRARVKPFLKDPSTEGLFGGLAFVCSIKLAALLDLPLWAGLLTGIILAFFLLTHGIYRDFGKDEE